MKDEWIHIFATVFLIFLLMAAWFMNSHISPLLDKHIEEAQNNIER